MLLLGAITSGVKMSRIDPRQMHFCFEYDRVSDFRKRYEQASYYVNTRARWDAARLEYFPGRQRLHVPGCVVGDGEDAIGVLANVSPGKIPKGGGL